jgi:hypothetical protein
MERTNNIETDLPYKLINVSQKNVQRASRQKFTTRKNKGNDNMADFGSSRYQQVTSGQVYSEVVSKLSITTKQ